jgi:16S rRNA (uracil1498-N3)-methyltransferase
MPIERYFLEEAIQINENKILEGSEFHHLSRVMRTRVGDDVEVINGKGVLAQAVVREIGKDKAVLRIENLKIIQPSESKIVLAQAFPKPNRLDFILEKGTELGVDEFWLFPGKLSQKKDFSVNQLERTRTLTIAAMKQCGRLTLPLVKIMPALGQWPKLDGRAFFGDLAEDAPLFWKAWSSKGIVFPVIFFVGPESGWGTEEMHELKSMGVQAVKLHDNILRTDTASLTAISLVHHWLSVFDG